MRDIDTRTEEERKADEGFQELLCQLSDVVADENQRIQKALEPDVRAHDRILVQVPDQIVGESFVEEVLDSPGVDAAYLKPVDSPPVELESPPFTSPLLAEFKARNFERRNR